MNHYIYEAEQCQPIRRHDAYPLLEPFTVSIKKGEWITLVGHNGSGKSTLARFIAGHQRTGMDLKGSEQRYGQGAFPMVTQLTSQYLLGSTPYEDLVICYEQYGEPMDRDRLEQYIDELLRQLQLQHLKHVPLTQLSGGEKQLVAVAGALLMKANKLLVLDELTSMLSERNKWQVCQLIRDLAAAKELSVIWITQQLDELKASDTIWVMDKLELVARQRACELFGCNKEDGRSTASELGLPIPWSVYKSMELGFSSEQIQFNPYDLAKAVKHDAVSIR